MPKTRIKIELSKKEDAILYAEKTLGRNKTIQKRATVLYYAGQGADIISDLSKMCRIHRDFVSRTLKGFQTKGIDYIYQCSRGIKHSALDKIEAELLADFDKNPPASIPEAVSRIQNTYGIELTDTPVRYWLKKRGFIISSQEQFRQKPI